MQLMTWLRAARGIAWFMVSIAMLPYLASGAVAAGEQTVKAHVLTVLLFPLDSSSDKNGPQVASDLSDFIRDGISAGKSFRVIEYSQRLPAVRRLVAMQPDNTGIAMGPFSSNAASISKAVSIGAATSADLVVVGSIDTYTFDAAGKAEVMATIQVVDGVTGKSIRTTAVTGKAVKSANEPVDEASLMEAAVKDAGKKIVADITGADYSEVAPPPVTADNNAANTDNTNKKKPSKLPWLLLLAGVGLIAGLSGGHGHSSSGGSSAVSGPDTPPVSPF